jgi:hypothetical protein
MVCGHTLSCILDLFTKPVAVAVRCVPGWSIAQEIDQHVGLIEIAFDPLHVGQIKRAQSSTDTSANHATPLFPLGKNRCKERQCLLFIRQSRVNLQTQFEDRSRRQHLIIKLNTLSSRCRAGNAVYPNAVADLQSGDIRQNCVVHKNAGSAGFFVLLAGVHITTQSADKALTCLVCHWAFQRLAKLLAPKTWRQTGSEATQCTGNSRARDEKATTCIAAQQVISGFAVLTRANVQRRAQPQSGRNCSKCHDYLRSMAF